MADVRLFFALALPAEVADSLSALQWGPPGARWTLPDQLHLTVRFLGDTKLARAHDLAAGLDELRASPMTLQLQGVGCAPPGKAPRVLFAGVRDPAPVLALREALDRRLAALGWPRTGERLRPHVTVARLLSADPAAVASWLSGHGLFRSQPFEAQELTLFRSTRLASGSEYEALQIVPLRPGPGVAAAPARRDGAAGTP